MAITYRVTGDGPTRIVVKLLWRYPAGRLARAVMAPLLPAGDLVMMRKQLLTLKELAEGEAATPAPSAAAS